MNHCSTFKSGYTSLYHVPDPPTRPNPSALGEKPRERKALKHVLGQPMSWDCLTRQAWGIVRRTSFPETLERDESESKPEWSLTWSFPGSIHLTDSDTRFKTAPPHMRGTKSRRTVFQENDFRLIPFLQIATPEIR